MEEYLARFRLLQHGLEKDERLLVLLQSPAYRSFVHRFGKSEDPLISGTIITEEALQKRLGKRQRLCEQYAARIARAIGGIEVPELQDYARYHFLYGLTHEEIAEQSYFSVRTVYRHGKKAREALREQLLKVSPKIKRIPPCRFRIHGELRRKQFQVDSLSRNIACYTARRRGGSISLRPKGSLAQ